MSITVFAAAVLAATDAPPRFELNVDDACGVSAVAVAHLVVLELRKGLADASEWNPRVLVACQGELATLHVDDPVSRKSVERTISFAHEEPPARERLFALAIAELVIASWTELLGLDDPSVPSTLPPPPAEVRSAARDAVVERLAARAEVHALADALVLGGRLFAAGGGAGVSFEVTGPVAAGLDVSVEQGSAPIEGGQVAATRAVATVSGAYRWHWARALAGASGGLAYVRGRANSPSLMREGSGVGPWSSLWLGAGAATAWGKLSLEARFTAGVGLHRVVATVNGAPALDTGGPFAGIEVRLGVTP